MRPQLETIDRDNKALLQEKGMTIIEYPDSFFDEVLGMDSVQKMYSDIDAVTGGLASLLTGALG